jgi:hypothetical protein
MLSFPLRPDSATDPPTTAPPARRIEKFAKDFRAVRIRREIVCWIAR